MNGFSSYEKALYSGDVEATRETEARYDENPELAELDRYAATKESVDAAASGLRSFNGVAARTAGVVGSLATGNLPLASAIVSAGGAAGNLAEGGTVGEALTEGAIEGVSNYAGGKILELAGKGVVAGARRMARSLDDSLTWGGGTVDAIMKMRFAAPAGLSVGKGVGAASTQQAAKGGEAGPGKRESTAPTDEQLQEAAAFLRLVIEKGFAKTDDEIEKCERLARAIEAAVGAEPVEPREEPLRQAPLEPGEPQTQAAYDAGVYSGSQDDEDDPVKQIEKMSGDMFKEEMDVAIRDAIIKDVTGQDPTEVNKSVNENAIAVARGETKGRLSPAGMAEITALGAYDEFMGDKETFKVNAEGTDYDTVASDPSKKGNLVALNEALQAAKSQAERVDTSRIKYGPQPKTPTMDDVGKAVAAKHQPEVVIPGDDAPVAPAQEQPVQQAAVQPQQETLAPGLSRSGSRNNILEYEGRRISQREFDRIQAKFQEGGPQQPTGIGGRTLTAGEAAWQAKRQASTEAWMQRTGQNAVADAGLPEAQPNAEPREEMDGLGGEGGGLVKSGSRGNILTYKGKRTTDHEARRLGLI